MIWPASSTRRLEQPLAQGLAIELVPHVRVRPPRPRWIRAPASIDHRFFNEDVPFGLVAIAELGRAAGVPTPCADAVIDIASIVAARPFRTEGLTRERMGIEGMRAAEVSILLETGNAP
jgi:hypothetical protein